MSVIAVRPMDVSVYQFRVIMLVDMCSLGRLGVLMKMMLVVMFMFVLMINGLMFMSVYMSFTNY